MNRQKEDYLPKFKIERRTDMRKMVCVAVAVLVLFLGASFAYAVDFELEPSIRAAGMKWKENGESEGHKSYVGIGIQGNISDFSNLPGLKLSLGLHEWRMGEAVDEDVEIPRQGYRAFVEISRPVEYLEISFSPCLGAGFEEWHRREENPKIAGSWQSLRFFSATAGVRADYKCYFAKVVAIQPFNIEGGTLKARTGYELNLGANLWKDLDLTLFYKETRFSNPATEMQLTGAAVSYRF
ncbi:hypothetical protein L6251_00330 [Candidatus Parcubacteria bacterium]|nr:hypothetical protein [Patescibacteria group bacterium]MBU4477196.1 hypothetical protein [Patescibacteria group bacterium]MCG2698860.1 hypothetical protein [Candidatus Parcubacteria bacterium]